MYVNFNNSALLIGFSYTLLPSMRSPFQSSLSILQLPMLWGEGGYYTKLLSDYNAESAAELNKINKSL